VTHDAWGWGFLDRLAQDVRFGMRMLAKSPGFTTVAILTLALGNWREHGRLFSIVNGVLAESAALSRARATRGAARKQAEFRHGLDFVSEFSGLAERQSHVCIHGDPAGQSVRSSSRAWVKRSRWNAVFVSTGFFEQLGVNPVLGRAFAPGEDRIGAAPTVMITGGFWKRKFGSAQDVLGKGLTLDGKDYTIIGVIPATFDLLGSLRTREVYVPIGQWNNPLLMNRAAGLGIGGIGRLKPGVTVQQARADMERVAQNLAAAYPEADKGIGAAVIPLRKWLLGSVEPFLLVLFGAVGFVLLYCVRERGESAAGPLDRAGARICNPCGFGRRARTNRPATSDGEHFAGGLLAEVLVCCWQPPGHGLRWASCRPRCRARRM